MIINEPIYITEFLFAKRYTNSPNIKNNGNRHKYLLSIVELQHKTTKNEIMEIKIIAIRNIFFIFLSSIFY
jgi:hypothetical protein